MKGDKERMRWISVRSSSSRGLPTATTTVVSTPTGKTKEGEREREEGSIEGTNEISPGQIVRESDAAEITPAINTLEIS